LHTFTQTNAKIHLLQSSAVSLWIATDFQEHKVIKIIDFLSEEFAISQTRNVQLLTILYYNEKMLQSILPKFELILEQKTQQTYRAVIAEFSA
jgi:aspartate kinase